MGPAVLIFNIVRVLCPSLATLSPNRGRILLVLWSAEEMGASLWPRVVRSQFKEAAMPRSLFTQAMRDMGDDIAHYSLVVAHGAFDLTCVVALALLVLATGIDSDPRADRPTPDVQARVIGPPAPTCSEGADCITAVVLTALDA
jgi:hypothetical protein